VKIKTKGNYPRARHGVSDYFDFLNLKKSTYFRTIQNLNCDTDPAINAGIANWREISKIVIRL
jgi:hypothetical protein